MLRRVAIACVLLALPGSARADVAAPPSALWGSPSPRTVPDSTGQRRAVGLVHFEWMSGEALPPEGRDPAVEQRSERLEVVVLRNVVWLRGEVVLRASEDLSSWSMGIAEHAYRRSGLEMHFFEVRVDGELTPTFERSVPVRPPAAVDDLARDGFDAWREWRLDLARGRDVTVRFELVRPAAWRCPDEEPPSSCPGAERLTQEISYARHDAARFAGGPSALEVVVHAPAGSRLVRGARDDETPLGSPFEVEGTDAVVLALDVPAAREPADSPSAPAWLALLDRSLVTDGFAPTAARPIAPGYDADGFDAHVDELRAHAASDDVKLSEVARGLLEALRERLRWTVDRTDPSWDGHDVDDTGAELPRPHQVGAFGTQLDTDDWRDAVQGAMDWTTPPGEPPITFRPDDPLGVEEVSERPPTEEAPTEDTRRTLLRLLDERYQRPTSSGARRPDPRASARSIGLEAGPPFGLPNQLVQASLDRDRDWELPAVVLTLALVLAGLYAWRRRSSARPASRA